VLIHLLLLLLIIKKKAEDIKHLATSLYSTSFDNFNNVFAQQAHNPFESKMNTNPYQQPSSNGFPTQAVFGSVPTHIFNTNPTGGGFGQQSIGNLIVMPPLNYSTSFGSPPGLNQIQVNTNPNPFGAPITAVSSPTPTPNNNPFLI